MNHTLLQKKSLQYTLHGLVWLGLLAFPLILVQSDSRFNMRMLNHIWISIIMSMVIFYTNYGWLVNHMAFKKRIVPFILINLLLFTTLSLIGEFIQQQVSPPINKKPPFSLRWLGNYSIFFYREYIIYSLVTGIAIAVKIGQRLNKSETERKRLETENLKSEVALLKYQIQPHFFFNTLNNIYVLIGKSPAEAQQAIHRLSKMMRHILYENNADHIPLEKEIEFLENYNRLMQLRLTPNTKVEITYPQAITGIEVPPLLFVSLLENAYKHGVSNSETSFIRNKMEIRENQLIFTVENSLHQHCKEEDRSGSGIGIKNMKKRLDIIYGDRYSLTLCDKNCTFKAELTIPSHF